MALPTNQPIAPLRNTAATMRGPSATNQEQPFHPIYNYAVVTDAEEGLILVNIDTMADGEPRNNFLQARGDLERGWRAERRAAHHAGRPLSPISPPTPAWSSSISPIRCIRALAADRPAAATRAPRALQFRYLWVTDAEGAEAVRRDPAGPAGAGAIGDDAAGRCARASMSPAPMPMSPARRDGLVIVNVTKPERPAIYRKVDFRRADERCRRT